MCRCGERRVALSEAARALTHGEMGRAGQSVQFVMHTMAEDGRALATQAAQRLSAARARLVRR